VPEFGRLLPPAPSQRRGTPLYYAKSEEETRRDVYERYDELVTRQTLLHLADPLHGGYPFRPLADYLSQWLPDGNSHTVADVGCSVGRLIGDIATRHPNWDCYGIDFSYQMLRQARDYWLKGETLSPDVRRYGYPATSLPGHRLGNLHFALADAAALPFPDQGLDTLFSTFLIDRLADPRAFFTECLRILRPAAPLILVSPLNFLKREQWDRYFPPVKLLQTLLERGWHLLDLTDPLPIDEPLDARGNRMRWNCWACVLQKPE
jgi:ubiquinone/menaquinone biosynthesis C-methylase UbiE